MEPIQAKPTLKDHLAALVGASMEAKLKIAFAIVLLFTIWTLPERIVNENLYATAVAAAGGHPLSWYGH